MLRLRSYLQGTEPFQLEMWEIKNWGAKHYFIFLLLPIFQGYTELILAP